MRWLLVYHSINTVYMINHYYEDTLWPKVCVHLITTPICGSSIHSCHKIGSIVYMMSMYAMEIQFPFIGTMKPKPMAMSL